jgi:hypothetical protein
MRGSASATRRHRADLAARELGTGRRVVEEHHPDLPAEEILHRRRRALLPAIDRGDCLPGSERRQRA